MPGPLKFTDEDLDTAARTGVGEASNQPYAGKVGVLWVIRYRTEHPGWWTRKAGDLIADDSVSAACRHPMQFSCWNGGADTTRIKGLSRTSDEYQGMLDLAIGVLRGSIDDPFADMGGASHYKRVDCKASWDSHTIGRPSRTIGDHIFYNIGLTG